MADVAPNYITITVGTDRGTPFPLAYELHGHGDIKLLLIMGMGATGTAWQLNVGGLLSLNQNLHICTYDNRGIGRSGSPSQRCTTSEMARDAVDLLKHLGWQKAHVVGLSMGGMIAQELVFAWGTDHILSLTLAVTHAGRTFAPWAGLWGMMKSSSKKTPEEKAPILMDMLYTKRFLEARHEPTGKTNYEFLAERYIVRKKNEPAPVNEMGHVQAVTTHYVSDDRLRIIKRAPFPSLVIGASQDVLVASHNAVKLKDLIEPAEYIMFESGHHVPIEKFDEFNAAVLRNITRANGYVPPAK